MSFYQLDIPHSTDRLRALPKGQRLSVIDAVLDEFDFNVAVDFDHESSQFLFYVDIDSNVDNDEVDVLIDYYKSRVVASILKHISAL